MFRCSYTFDASEVRCCTGEWCAFPENHLFSNTMSVGEKDTILELKAGFSHQWAAVVMPPTGTICYPQVEFAAQHKYFLARIGNICVTHCLVTETKANR